VPTGFAVQPCRHVIVAIATWLIVLQAFLGGVATAQAAAMPALAAGDAICHGSGSVDAGDGTTPENSKLHQFCCVACTSAAPALAAPDVPMPMQLAPVSSAAAFASFIVVIAPGNIRAGLSQAPPPLA
jgi:hypothetical protein